MFSLRPYQQEAVQLIRQAYQQGHQGVVLRVPTGGGKTVIFGHIIQQMQARGTKAIITAHRQELVYQAADKLAHYEVDHGIIMGQKYTNPGAPVQVASIQTVAKRKLPWTPDLIIIDEAHLIRGNTYEAFIDKFPTARRLLVTATPKRLDGKGLGRFASTMIEPVSVQDLIDQGYLVKPRVLSSPARIELKGVKKIGGDFSAQDLNLIVNTVQLVGDVVRHYKEHLNGKRAVCFTVSISHSLSLVAEFNAQGVPAEHIDGKLSDKERAAILQRLRNGYTKVVCNCNVLCEGWDEPTIEGVILARPTQSETLYIQQAGRGLRPCPEIGKTECIILDHGENVHMHGHITDERMYSLEDEEKPVREMKPQEEEEDPLKSVSGLFKQIEQLDARLVEIEGRHPQYNRLLQTYRYNCMLARNTGKRKESAWYRTQEQLGLTTVAMINLLGIRVVPWSVKQKPDYEYWLQTAKRIETIEEALEWTEPTTLQHGSMAI